MVEGSTVGMPDFAAIIGPALEASTIPEAHRPVVAEALRNRLEANVRRSSENPATAETQAANSVGDVISEIASQLAGPRVIEGVTEVADEVTPERIDYILNGLCDKFRFPYPWCPARA